MLAGRSSGRQRGSRRTGYVVGAVAIGACSVAAAGALAAGESLDASFDGNGAQTTAFTTVDLTSDWGHDIAIEPDGQIVVAGTADESDTIQDFGRFGLLRYNTDGSLDTAGFGGGTGKVSTDFGDYPSGVAKGIAVQSDGKIVVAGGGRIGTEFNFAVARYGSDGVLDSTTDVPAGDFSGDGKATLDVAQPAVGSSNEDIALDVAIAPDNGDIVTAGSPNVFKGGQSEINDIGIGVWDANGNPDASFSSDGMLQADRPANESFEGANAVAVQSDGKIVVAGWTSTGSGDIDSMLARFEADGDPDPTFDDDGYLILANSPQFEDQFYDLALQPDGKIVAVGSGDGPNGGNSPSFIAVTRVNSNGTLDSSFDGDGRKAITAFFDNPSGEVGTEVEIMGNGKIVIAGVAGVTPFSPDFEVMRLTSNGVLDSAKVRTSFPSGGGASNLDGMAVQSDGKVLLSGTAYQEEVQGAYAFAVMRFASLGTPPDETRPSTTLLGVRVKSRRRKATVTFTGSDNKGAVTFQCKLDAKAYSACSSPKVYKHLKRGKHTVSVRARDASGNLDASPATRTFRIKKRRPR